MIKQYIEQAKWRMQGQQKPCWRVPVSLTTYKDGVKSVTVPVYSDVDFWTAQHIAALKTRHLLTCFFPVTTINHPFRDRPGDSSWDT